MTNLNEFGDNSNLDVDIYNIIPCYFFSISNAGYITRINKMFLDHLSYNSAEVINIKRLEDILSVGSKIFFQTHFYPLIKLHGSANEIFLSFKSKAGVEIPVLLNVLLSGSKESFEIHCGGMQISQRNRFEKELLEAKKVAEHALLENSELKNLKIKLEQDQLLLEKKLLNISQKKQALQQINSVVSHDLQEPLRKMSLFSGQLEHDDENILSERSKSIIHKITGYALRMRELINNVQNYLTLIEKPFKSKPVDLDMAFGEAMRRVPGCESNSIKIIKDRLPIVSGDYDLMVTLFCHLLDNSIKFRREGCDLEINVETDHIKRNIYIELDGKYKYEEYIRIAFSDNGIGFNNRYATTIFELFRKANNTHKGYGIGLSFCKKIIEFHHGLIEGKSSPGIKTTFTILLPMPKARNKNKGDIQ